MENGNGNSKLMKWLKLLGLLATVLSALTGAALSIHTVSSTFKDPVAAQTVDEHKLFIMKNTNSIAKNREEIIHIYKELLRAQAAVVKPAPPLRAVTRRVPRTIRRMSRPAPAPPARLTPPDKLFDKLRSLPKIKKEAPPSYEQMQQQYQE